MKSFNNKQSSTKLKLLAVITVVITMPALLVAISLIVEFSFPFTDWLLIEKMAVLITGLLGGILLFNGKRLGYTLSIIAWAIIFIQSCSAIYQLYPAMQSAVINMETAKLGLTKAGVEMLLSIFMLIAINRARRISQIN